MIVATAFIHVSPTLVGHVQSGTDERMPQLLAPSWEALGSECLTGTWTVYPWPAAFAMSSVFALFIVELVAHRTGQAYLRKRGLRHVDHHSQDGNPPAHSTHGAHVDDSPRRRGEARDGLAAQEEQEGQDSPGSSLYDEAAAKRAAERDGGKSRRTAAAEEAGSATHAHGPAENNAAAQIIGVAILEFGVIFHSVIIGLTLAVDAEFTTLFVVIIFHQMFEGLGLGARLSLLPLPSAWRWVPYVGAVGYAAVTPIGTAIGLGVRHAYNPESQTAVIVAGVLDGISAGILLWTGLVELLAHDFIFNRQMVNDASNAMVAYAVSCIVLGALLMALLGRWA